MPRTLEVGLWTGQSLVADQELVGDGVDAEQDFFGEASALVEVDEGRRGVRVDVNVGCDAAAVGLIRSIRALLVSVAGGPSRDTL